eukprot:TRINITY_DN17718_c0_g1_i1.p1 TRINITY_DN17718_c0_g1~~TRINITY_DN17718_c0_g1_i1.p1  ORF type:complete len:389 (-),score=81.76 TRINITY_DN17718_c0_g1_i1:244-1410(-)
MRNAESWGVCKGSKSRAILISMLMILTMWASYMTYWLQATDPTRILDMTNPKITMFPERPTYEGPKRFFSLKVSAGISNQKISIITAAALAYMFNATLILPNVRQHFMHEHEKSTPFGSIFDRSEFTYGLDGIIDVVKRPPKNFVHEKHEFPCIKMKECPAFPLGTDNSLSQLHKKLSPFVRDNRYIQLNVPFRIWKPSSDLEWQLWFRINDALVFNDDVYNQASLVMTELPSNFVAVHMRSESFFVITGNQSASAMQVSQWINENIPASIPIYIMSGDLSQSLLQPFHSERKVYTWKSSWNEPLPSQLQAAIDYLVGVESKLFITNTIHSTFDVFLRWDRHQKAQHKHVCQLYGRHKFPLEGPVTAIGSIIDFCPDIISSVFPKHIR